MSLEMLIKELTGSFELSTYAKWMKAEGIPVFEGYGLEDVRDLKLSPWPRLGGKGRTLGL